MSVLPYPGQTEEAPADALVKFAAKLEDRAGKLAAEARAQAARTTP